jgi:hypothetical protein
MALAWLASPAVTTIVSRHHHCGGQRHDGSFRTSVVFSSTSNEISNDDPKGIAFRNCDYGGTSNFHTGER